MIQPDIFHPSPNKYERPVIGRTVIIHATRSGKPMNPTEFAGTLNYMASPGTTSSHWVISRTGLKARVVQDQFQAWHAAADNDNCWGIELEQGAEMDGFELPQLNALIEICRDYMAECNVPAVHVTSSSEPGFIGHQETAQGRGQGKSDPGRLFPWLWFIGALLTPQVDLEGGAMFILSKRKVWPEGQRDGTDWFKSYLVMGRAARHIPDQATYESLRAMGLEDFEPDATAWDFLAGGLAFE